MHYWNDIIYFARLVRFNGNVCHFSVIMVTIFSGEKTLTYSSIPDDLLWEKKLTFVFNSLQFFSAKNLTFSPIPNDLFVEKKFGSS